MRMCDWPRCTSEAGPAHFVHGKAYCVEHCEPAIREHFMKEYEAWDDGKPGKKFRDLFARYCETCCELPEELTKVKLNHPYMKFTKIDDGLEFRIPTPLPEYKHPERPQLVEWPRWRLYVAESRLELLPQE